MRLSSRLGLTAFGVVLWLLSRFTITILAATPATLAATSNSNYEDHVDAEATSLVSWTSGDLVLVTGATEDNTRTIGTPTTVGTGVTFALEVATNTTDECKMYLWSATASATSSGVIAATPTGGPAAGSGITVWVWSGHNGIGTETSATNQTAKTFSYTRSEDNTGVIQSLCDWNAVSDTATDPTPATNATQRCGDDTCHIGGEYTVFVADWTDQGTAGATSYGVTNHTGTVSFSHVTVEIKGTGAGAAAVVRFPLLGVGP